MGVRTQRAAEARRALGNVTRELAALDSMTVAELAVKFEEVFGFPTRTRNKAYLRKRVAWKIQELNEGGLSDRALERIEALAKLAPARWRQRSERRPAGEGPAVGPAQAPAPAAAAPRANLIPPPPPRDPRLPPAGSVLRREFRGDTYDVRVGEADFEYAGERYASLSQVARAITGTAWNGYLFFGLAKRGRALRGGEA